MRTLGLSMCATTLQTCRRTLEALFAYRSVSPNMFWTTIKNSATSASRSALGVSRRRRWGTHFSPRATLWTTWPSPLRRRSRTRRPTSRTTCGITLRLAIRSRCLSTSTTCATSTARRQPTRLPRRRQHSRRPAAMARVAHLRAASAALRACFPRSHLTSVTSASASWKRALNRLGWQMSRRRKTTKSLLRAHWRKWPSSIATRSAISRQSCCIMQSSRRTSIASRCRRGRTSSKSTRRSRKSSAVQLSHRVRQCGHTVSTQVNCVVCAILSGNAKSLLSVRWWIHFGASELSLNLRMNFELICAQLLK
eukprot:Opistho-2@3923